MTLIDIIILTLVTLSAIWGAFKGFVSQIVSIAALIAGVWCAFKFSRCFTGWFKDLVPGGEHTLYVIAFIVIMIIVIIIGHFLGKGIESIVKISMLGWLNRLLGVVFAALKTIVILSIIVYLIDYINGAWHIFPGQYTGGSKCYQALGKIAANLFPYLKGFFN